MNYRTFSKKYKNMNRCFKVSISRISILEKREEKYNNNERDWIRKENNIATTTTTTDSRL